MKKGSLSVCKFFLVAAVTLLTLSLFSSTYAAEPAINETKEAAALNSSAYWLFNQVNTKWNTLNSEDASWALLALSSVDSITEEAKSALINKSKDTECWPSTNCKVKSTAIAILALNELGEDTEIASDWILTKQKAYTTSGVSWYLQLDSDDATNCTISYPVDSSTVTAKLNINKNKTYAWKEGNGGSCLTISNDKYWLALASNCIDKTFTITCTKEVIASLPYKYSNELYVPSESTRSSSTFEMAIRTLCLKESTSECDYDSTLWATYALYTTGRSEYSSFIPYLVEKYSDNKNYFPESILYRMTYSADYLNSTMSAQKRAGYFESDSSSNGRFYDTALAVNAIGDISNTIKAKNWLISNQSKDGNEWGTSNKIKDTSMIFYFIWPDYQLTFIGSGSSIDGGSTDGNQTFTECEDTYLFACRARCSSSETKANYSCGTGRKVCCMPKDLPVNECESTYSFFCRTSCVEGEESANYTCVSGTCCKPKGETIKCNTVKDCKKRECKGKTVEDDDGNLGTCEYPSEYSCNDDFDNDGDGKVDFNDEIDCSKKCSEKDGRICDPGQMCEGSSISAFDTNECCLGDCITEETLTCSEQGGYECSSGKCSGNIISASDSSNCCSSKCSSSKTIWIILLILLILGAIGFFLYKKGFFSKMMIRFSKKSPPKAPSQMLQYIPAVRPLHMPQMPPHQQPHPPVHPMQRKEGKSELDDTLNKLKRFAEK